MGNTQKKLFLSHVDLDGVSAFILLYYFRMDKEFDTIVGRDYVFEEGAGERDDLYQYDEIFMVDLSLPQDLYEDLIAKGKKITIFDHHESSQWMIGLPNVTHSMDKCGTKLFYEYCKEKYPEKDKSIVSEFVELVNAYDLFLTDSPLWVDAQNMNRIMYKMYLWYPEDRPVVEKAMLFIQFEIDKMENLDTWRWTQKEQRMINVAIDRENLEYKNFMSHLQLRRDTKGYIFGISKLSAKISIVAYNYLKDNPQIQYVVIQNCFRELNTRLSTRTQKDDFSLPENFSMVKGHAKAAGGEWASMEEVKQFMSGDIWSLSYIDETWQSMKYHMKKDLT